MENLNVYYIYLIYEFDILHLFNEVFRQVPTAAIFANGYLKSDATSKHAKHCPKICLCSIWLLPRYIDRNASIHSIHVSELNDTSESHQKIPILR